MAVVAHAPVAAVPFVVAICVGAPMVAVWEISRSRRGAESAIDELRGYLDQLPETRHPLGL